jgi:hypothetical protein
MSDSAPPAAGYGQQQSVGQCAHGTAVEALNFKAPGKICACSVNAPWRVVA